MEIEKEKKAAKDKSNVGKTAKEISRETETDGSTRRKSTQMKNIRRNIGCVPIPKTYEEINLTEVEQKKLLYMDDSMMVFGDNRLFDVLKCSDELYLDGTFKVVPKPLYNQLYTIHCKGNTLIFPVVYALMKHKDNESYNKLFGIVENSVGDEIFHKGKRIMGDFEVCNFNFLPSEVERKACYFHFTQNIYRRAQTLSVEEYKKRGSFIGLVGQYGRY